MNKEEILLIRLLAEIDVNQKIIKKRINKGSRDIVDQLDDMIEYKTLDYKKNFILNLVKIS